MDPTRASRARPLGAGCPPSSSASSRRRCLICPLGRDRTSSCLRAEGVPRLAVVPAVAIPSRKCAATWTSYHASGVLTGWPRCAAWLARSSRLLPEIQRDPIHVQIRELRSRRRRAGSFRRGNGSGGDNIAARVEGLADPGGICISLAARDQVRDKLDVVLDDMGEVEVKNIARPLRVFRVLLGSEKSSGGESATSTGSALALPNKPSIAVLPFDNMSGDAEQEYFADGPQHGDGPGATPGTGAARTARR